MTTTKLVIRLLTAEGQMLGWEAVEALVRGDGKLWSHRAITIVLDAPGTVTTVSMHWADVNVEARTEVAHTAVQPGQRWVVCAKPAPLWIVGPMAGGLPPISTRENVIASVRAAMVGATSG